MNEPIHRSTENESYFTPEQLASMPWQDVVALIRRNSGDPNFHWRVREAVLNRAADQIERSMNLLRLAYEDVPGWVGDVAEMLGRIRHE